QGSEVERLRDEVQQLRGEVERLRTLVESAKPQPAAQAAGERTEQSTSQLNQSTTQVESTGATQRAAAQDITRVAVATKAQGGDLAGAGNLLRTDRITIGGYGDAE